MISWRDSVKESLFFMHVNKALKKDLQKINAINYFLKFIDLATSYA
jgi:hypothetical protein